MGAPLSPTALSYWPTCFFNMNGLAPKPKMDNRKSQVMERRRADKVSTLCLSLALTPLSPLLVLLDDGSTLTTKPAAWMAARRLIIDRQSAVIRKQLDGVVEAAHRIFGLSKSCQFQSSIDARWRRERRLPLQWMMTGIKTTSN